MHPGLSNPQEPSVSGRSSSGFFQLELCYPAPMKLGRLPVNGSKIAGCSSGHMPSLIIPGR